MKPTAICRHCKQSRELGAVVQAYYLGRHPSGDPQIVWLCREPCSQPWHEKWRAWMREQREAA